MTLAQGIELARNLTWREGDSVTLPQGIGLARNLTWREVDVEHGKGVRTVVKVVAIGRHLTHVAEPELTATRLP